MGQLDTSGIPAWAVTMWTNDREIFVAMPMKDRTMPPYIISFPYTPEGLARALRILHDRPKEVIVPTAAAPANYTRPPNPEQVKPLGKIRERVHAESTQEQRDAAAALIKRLGLVKT